MGSQGRLHQGLCFQIVEPNLRRPRVEGTKAQERDPNRRRTCGASLIRPDQIWRKAPQGLAGCLAACKSTTGSSLWKFFAAVRLGHGPACCPALAKSPTLSWVHDKRGWESSSPEQGQPPSARWNHFQKKRQPNQKSEKPNSHHTTMNIYPHRRAMSDRTTATLENRSGAASRSPKLRGAIHRRMRRGALRIGCAAVLLSASR